MRAGREFRAIYQHAGLLSRPKQTVCAPAQEKLDHLGIVASVIGTPMSTLLMRHPEADFSRMFILMAALLAAAFLPPFPRVFAWMVGTGILIGSHHSELGSTYLTAEIILYVFAAAAFLR